MGSFEFDYLPDLVLAEHCGVESFLEVVEILVVEHPAEDSLHPL